MNSLSSIFNQALSCHQNGQLEQASSLYQKILEANPEHVETLHFKGLLEFEMKNYKQAQQLLEKTLELKPDLDDLYVHLGHVNKELGHLNQSVNYYLKYIEKQPHNYPLLFHIGLIYMELEQWPSAEYYFKQVTQLDPKHAEALNHLALAHKEQRYLMDSLQCMQRALKLAPNSIQYAYNYACLLLLLGKYEEGFKYLEKRLKLPGNLPVFNKPMWDGSPLNGKRLLIYAEQGFGDTIQFARYIPLIKQRHNTLITLVVQEELYTLFEGFEGVEQIIKTSEQIPDFETYTFTMSLPHIFKTTIENVPLQTPYIKVNLDSPVRKLPDAKLKVGLVWASGFRDYNQQLISTYYKKSINLDELLEYIDLPEIDLFSLQVGKDSLEENHNYPLVDLQDDISNFNETAAFIEQMDVVISVDTAVAHLAGAMGKPIWLLLPYVPSWRWLLSRSDSPWYSSVKIYRQAFSNRWEEPLKDIRENLMELVK